MRFDLNIRTGLALLTILFLQLASGCKVGPNFVPPTAHVRNNWSIDYQPIVQGDPVNISRWWEHLQDPVLSNLVECSRQQNVSLKVAGERLQEARFRRAVAAGNLFPQSQTANGSFSKAKTSINEANFFSFPGVFEPNIRPENWRVGLQSSWELDFWGRYRRIVEASDAMVGEAEATLQDALVLITAEVAQTYLEIRTLEARTNLARSNLEVQRRTLEQAKQKREAGLATAIDVAQSTTIFSVTEATLPLLEIQRRQAHNRLSILLGHPPIDLTQQIGSTADIPEPPVGLAFGIPADLMRRRPDVRRAEQQLAAQSAKIGVAKAEFYPHISLFGSVGYSAENFSQLFNRQSTVAVISPNFSWNILNYGRIKNNVEAEKAAFRSLAFSYQQAVLQAQREAEDSQVAYVLGFDRLKSLQRATQGAYVAVEKAEQSYREGAIDYGRVYILQSELLRQQDEMVQAKSDIVLALIGIFKSIGGGWEVEESSNATMYPDGWDGQSVSATETVVSNKEEAEQFGSDSIGPIVEPSFLGDPTLFIPLPGSSTHLPRETPVGDEAQGIGDTQSTPVRPLPPILLEEIKPLPSIDF